MCRIAVPVELSPRQMGVQIARARGHGRAVAIVGGDFDAADLWKFVASSPPLKPPPPPLPPPPLPPPALAPSALQPQPAVCDGAAVAGGAVENAAVVGVDAAAAEVNGAAAALAAGEAIAEASVVGAGAAAAVPAGPGATGSPLQPASAAAAGTIALVLLARWQWSPIGFTEFIDFCVVHKRLLMRLGRYDVFDFMTAMAPQLMDADWSMEPFRIRIVFCEIVDNVWHEAGHGEARHFTAGIQFVDGPAVVIWGELGCDHSLPTDRVRSVAHPG